MKIKNKYKNRDTNILEQTLKVTNITSNILNKSRESTPTWYKKKNRKSLRIAFRNLTLSGSLIGINKI